MANKKISRNDPCPCGSGKKFKHCCIGKNIDWETRPSGDTKRPSPFPASRPRITRSPGLSALCPFHVVDARLKEVARVAPGAADWKAAVEGLSDTTPDGERIASYKSIRDAGVIFADAALFLFGHAVQWMSSKEDDLDSHTLISLRRFGLDDLADLYAADLLEYERRHERGRQFFFGPPDDMLAQRLREKGVID
jgi:hypothetical protein